MFITGLYVCVFLPVYKTTLWFRSLKIGKKNLFWTPAYTVPPLHPSKSYAIIKVMSHQWPNTLYQFISFFYGEVGLLCTTCHCITSGPTHYIRICYFSLASCATGVTQMAGSISSEIECMPVWWLVVTCRPISSISCLTGRW